MKTAMRKTDELLDAALQMTFPASDPIAVDAPVRRRRKPERGTLPRTRGSDSATELGGAVAPDAPRA